MGKERQDKHYNLRTGGLPELYEKINKKKRS